MAVIKFSFTPSPVGYSKGNWAIVAYLQGTTKRVPYLIEGLTSPSLAHWSKKEQRFLGGTQSDVDNNKLLDALRSQCEELQKNPQITTPQQFIDALKSGNVPDTDTTETLGAFIQLLIEEQRQLPTKNYQLYTSLFNNLNGENHKSVKGIVTTFEKPMYEGTPLIKTPLAQIADEHLLELANWVKRVKNGANFKNLNATLLHVVNVAIERKKIKHAITFKFRSHAPKKVKTTSEPLKALTSEQFEKVLTFSGQVINPNGHRNRQLQPLYLDVALLQYYTMSRPADVLLWRSDMIKTLPNGTKVLCYIPYKKRTHNNATEVILPLNPKALAIIEKYNGQSKGGYILPLPMNETNWDITTKDGNDKWRIASNTVLGNINAHLKKVGTLVGVEGLTLYYFRRSVFSHVASTGVNSTLLAKHGGTSVRMLEKHYIKDTELQPLVF
ncbi:MAG: hypothetical protein NC411_06695 [Bacteroides sp.]|nr:hypothetical protein [Bacteroides sp.]